MARIVYGVAGEGFGHSSRSHLIGQHLMDAGHEVLFVASRKSLAYLKNHFGDKVKETFGLCLVYQNRRLSASRTLTTNARRLIQDHSINQALYRQVIEPFSPDLVISDFEPFSAWWALRHGVPFISVDHQHMLPLCQLDRGLDSWTSRLSADFVTRCHYLGAASYIILNFFRAPSQHSGAILAPPVVRPQVQKMKPSRQDHLVVYTTDPSCKPKLLNTLAGFPHHTFFIYGLNENECVGNCFLKKTSTNGFLRDLATSRGVIATAGFSLISECLFLRKKMLLLPIQGQYEQMVNAHYVQKLGLGLAPKRLDTCSLAGYLSLTETPMPKHPDILWPNNASFFETIERVINRVLAKHQSVQAHVAHSIARRAWMAIARKEPRPTSV